MITRGFCLKSVRPDHIVGAISYLHRGGQSCLARDLEGLPLRTGNIAFLLHLYRCEGESQDELARALGYDKATAARACQALEEEGFVRRLRDPDDRRRTRLYLTEVGHEVRRTASNAVEGLNETLLAGMDEEERKEAARLLGLMVYNLEQTRTLRGGEE